MDSAQWMLQDIGHGVGKAKPEGGSESSGTNGSSNSSLISRQLPPSSSAAAAAMQQEKKVRPPRDTALNCPRCHSTNTKFCYYNNYSLTQPRYLCKTCRRYWTDGGTLRNVPVGGGSRRNNKKLSSSSSSTSTPHSSMQISHIKNIPDLNPSNINHQHHQNPKIFMSQDLSLGFVRDYEYNFHDHEFPKVNENSLTSGFNGLLIRSNHSSSNGSVISNALPSSWASILGGNKNYNPFDNHHHGLINGIYNSNNIHVSDQENTTTTTTTVVAGGNMNSLVFPFGSAKGYSSSGTNEQIQAAGNHKVDSSNGYNWNGMY